MMMEPSIRYSLSSGASNPSFPPHGSSSSGDLTAESSASLASTSSSSNSIFLNSVPEELQLSYGKIPLWQQTFLAVGSATAAVLSSSAGRSSQLTWTAKKVIKVLVRAFLTALASTAVVQDVLYSPSRVATLLLSEKGWLPSPLSRIATIQPKPLLTPTDSAAVLNVDDGGNNMPITVHYLLYESTTTNNNNKNTEKKNINENYVFDCLHFNHGFGASSLSWLPVLPPLVDRLSAKVGIAHDAIGFGFTERPGPSFLKMYSFDTSAEIGLSLILQNATEAILNHNPTKNVALFGHSMGALATLRMALHLPQHVNVSVVLVSPALITGKKQAKQLKSRSVGPIYTSDNNITTYPNKSITTKTGSMQIITPPVVLQKILSKLQRMFLFAPFQYVLKRVVASKDAWRSGLQAVWGNPDLVSDDDVLRYRWPSLSKGWEEGLINFSTARGRTSSVDEIQILADAIQKPNVKVCIIHGTKDPVIPFQYSKDLLKVFPDIKLEAMEGLGHNCFEENPSKFVSLVKKLLT